MKLSRSRVADVLAAMNIDYDSSLYGFELHGRDEPWRLQHGGGIAGNGDRVWWITNVRGEKDPDWNMCVTRGQLVRELQRWKYGCNYKGPKCTCPKKCDCQDEPNGLVSNECPVHNDNPRVSADCRVRRQNCALQPYRPAQPGGDRR